MFALSDGSLPEGGTLIATDDLPRMQVLTTARSPTRYADTVYRNDYGWNVGPHYRFATNCHELPEYRHAKPTDGMTIRMTCPACECSPRRARPTGMPSRPMG